MMFSMPIAVSYQRFSSSQQGAGSTLKRQQAMVDSWLAQHPQIILSALSRVDSGKSAFKRDHLKEGLGAIIESIEVGDIKEGDYLLVEAIDRLGRFEPLDMITMVAAIVNTGVIIVTLEDGTHYTRDSLNNANSALLILSGKVQQAHEYSKRLANRIKASYTEKIVRARDGEKIKRKNPIWLTSEGRLIPKYAEMVRGCIELYLKGAGTRAIILELVGAHEYLKKVYPSTLPRWFSNPAIKGDWVVNVDTPEEEVLRDIFEPLIDRDTYATLQRELQHRSKTMSPAKKYELSQLVRCADCGKIYHFRRKNHNGYTIIYANCSTYLKRGKEFCTNSKTWPYEVLMHIFHNSYIDHLMAFVRSKRIQGNSKQIDTLVQDLASIEIKIKNISNAIENTDEQQYLLSSLNKYSEEKTTIKNEITALESGDTLLSDSAICAVIDSFKDADCDVMERRNILHKIGYHLLGSGNEMTSLDSLETPTSYILQRRSTKNKCYLVSESGPCGDVKIAIGRSGQVARANESDVCWGEFNDNLSRYHQGAFKTDFVHPDTMEMFVENSRETSIDRPEPLKSAASDQPRSAMDETLHFKSWLVKTAGDSTKTS